MKKKLSKTTITYIVLRIIVGFMFIMNIAGIYIVPNDSQKSRMIFNAFQSLGFLIVSLIPFIINKTIKVEIPNIMTIVFIVFCVCHFVLGEIADFYIKFNWWDSMLHTLSGSMLAILAFALLNMINHQKESFELNPIFVSIFAIFFAISFGVFWEILEFSIDGITGSNMQRYMHSITLEPFEGREALIDTMKDLVLDTIGALVIAIFGYISMKKKKRPFKNLIFMKNNNKKHRNIY